MFAAKNRIVMDMSQGSNMVSMWKAKDVKECDGMYSCCEPVSVRRISMEEGSVRVPGYVAQVY